MLATQMISCVEYVHKHKYIHRDIKPDNFAMGVGENSNKVYIIDFGLSKKFVDSNNRHIRNCSGKSLTGTARYASINALEGKEQSRRDDMESLFYVWIYLLRGKLPWMGLPAKGNKKYEAILMKKKSTEPEDLCSGLNSFFINYYTSVRSLKFEEEPNYAMYRKMIYDAMISDEIPFDYCYDWVKPNSVQQRNDIHNAISNTRRDDVLNHINLKISQHQKDLLRNEKDKPSIPSKDATKNSNSIPSKDVLLSSSNYTSSHENSQIKTTQFKKRQIIPLHLAKISEIRTNSNLNTSRTVSKYSTAVKKEVKPANKPKQTQTKVKHDSDHSSTKRFSTIKTNRRQNDGIHQVKDRTALFNATTNKYPVSYRTGMLPKWMMAHLTSTR
ncbi:Casein kinase I, putative [Trichomonas vaginalis G3]|uniref:Casein kinase I, putative n=1 Tax=Trichomonas vaginalis (strain ATCC PRA-98 / G3) TaxID=412133 RepID=A2DM93_TRIV3|nr:protein kinase protein [Trichomonas vaginalis G3]EAY18513.1 Casein kinase I, putative [Trichomonas vaginalis G3]KAI5489498.1 protein kinase protein [Trichomonas vaginalis G3]|eukprot:XP_001579499.1 Casein kinase I [Trichomonas vaginalis G3]